jgi:hypothetical protein
MAQWAWIPEAAWLRLALLAVGLAGVLAVVALRSRRHLWPIVGFTVVALTLFVVTQGLMVRLYSIGCGMNCGGIVYTDAASVGLDAILIAGVLSLPPRRVRPIFVVVGAAAASFAFLSLTVNYAVA